MYNNERGNQTEIKDGMNNIHPGTRVYEYEGCYACPYVVYDVHGNLACYKDMYEECEHR